ncbi:PAMP-induced secreted peptide 1 [Camellia lanceoleosa]|uniref:PAMP-induced secreted peptide 1 n=1 Tax=Camellia lanceoleosa TaxID=1840588 RepID=A0ACC0GRR4_9ERIC|nr:PAMP-induced secreted peptide 1 [Camellia lanceoleosa]
MFGFSASISKMYFSRNGVVLIVFVIFVALLCETHVGATRVLSEDFGCGNRIATYPSVFEKAKLSVACWLERLPSGPSPRGPGH